MKRETQPRFPEPQPVFTEPHPHPVFTEPNPYPEVFYDLSLIDKREPRALCADGLHAWGLVHMGASPLPPLFGEALVAMGRRLGGASTGDELSAYAVKQGWLKEREPDGK